MRRWKIGVISLGLIGFSVIIILFGLEHSRSDIDATAAKSLELLHPGDTSNTPDFTEAPATELQRINEEKATNVGSKVTFTTDFEGGYAPGLSKISDTHFELDFTNRTDRMFFFKLDGVSNKTVRIDLKGAPLAKWSTLNPVYSYLENIDLPHGADAIDIKNTLVIRGQNGPLLPQVEDTNAWHFMADVWGSSARTISFVQKFSQDEVFIAMKVPFTTLDEANLERSIASTKVNILTIGVSASGKPLKVFEIEDSQMGEKNPCVLMYAREHTDEHDNSWIVTGAIRRLIQEDAAAQQARLHCSFIFIPLLDPDGAKNEIHENIMDSFSAMRTSPESRAYAGYFKKRIDAGKRLDIVMNLHNLESGEGPHLAFPLIPTEKTANATAKDLMGLLDVSLSEDGLTVGKSAWKTGEVPTRLGGWLSDNYGALHFPCEVNSQEPERHLSRQELMAMGGHMALSVASFFDGDDGKRWLENVDIVRKKYASRWSLYGKNISLDDAIAAEKRCKWDEDSATESLK